MILIYGLFDNHIVIKTAKTEHKINVGSDQASKGVFIECEDDTNIFCRFVGGVWNAWIMSQGHYFANSLPPDISGPSPRIVEGFETSNRSFVVRMNPRLENAFVLNRNYQIK